MEEDGRGRLREFIKKDVDVIISMLTHSLVENRGVLFCHGDAKGAVCHHGYSSEQVGGSTRLSLWCL